MRADYIKRGDVITSLEVVRRKSERWDPVSWPCLMKAVKEVEPVRWRHISEGTPPNGTVLVKVSMNGEIAMGLAEYYMWDGSRHCEGFTVMGDPVGDNGYEVIAWMEIPE